MKKIITALLFILSINVFAIDDMLDKDNMHNLIDGVNSTRAGSDRISTIYNFSPLMNHNTPFKLGVSILDLRYMFDNTITNSQGEQNFAIAPKGFIGLSYGIFGIGYQFNLYNNLNEKNAPIISTHSASFGLATDKYRLSVPISFGVADGSRYGAKLAISTTPKFSFLFRGGLLDEFTISLHYGIQLSSITNNITDTSVAPMVIGGSLYGTVMLSRFDSAPVQISLPIKLAFYYGIKSRWATIDAAYAEDMLFNYLYNDDGERATDSMRFYIMLPAKFESKLGALYYYIMPRLMFEGNIYKTTGLYKLYYGIEGELQVTLIENLTFGLTAYADGQGLMRKDRDFEINNAFGAGLDIWGIWRY